jgi:hypothetical protein
MIDSSESGNAETETAKPWPKVARDASIPTDQPDGGEGLAKRKGVTAR